MPLDICHGQEVPDRSHLVDTSAQDAEDRSRELEDELWFNHSAGAWWVGRNDSDEATMVMPTANMGKSFAARRPFREAPLYIKTAYWMMQLSDYIEPIQDVRESFEAVSVISEPRATSPFLTNPPLDYFICPSHERPAIP